MLDKYIVTPSALSESKVRNFPISKHRSKRIHKKLVKKFNGEFKKEPAAFEVGGRIIIHPILYQQLKNYPLT
jgi:hypothetical protein